MNTQTINATVVFSSNLGVSYCFQIRADFTQASSPIEVRWGGDYWPTEGDFEPTVFQVADARHDYDEAAQLVYDWNGGEGQDELNSEYEYIETEEAEYDDDQLAAIAEAEADELVALFE